MLTVIETWQLKPEFISQSTPIMQEMDNIVGPNAHSNPGWRDHAKFYQNITHPQIIHMVYQWLNRQTHEDLVTQEINLLDSFIKDYCSENRIINYYQQLTIDV